MVQQVTNGIKVSVKTKFNGTLYHQFRLRFSFNYQITIENQSHDAVQLISRSWRIFDSLNNIEIIEGEGVIGEKPILASKKSFTYSSFSILCSPLGSMNGFFNMINFSTSKKFKVLIPSFQLSVPSISN